MKITKKIARYKDNPCFLKILCTLVLPEDYPQCNGTHKKREKKDVRKHWKIICAKVGIQREASSHRYTKNYEEKKNPTYKNRAPRTRVTCCHGQKGREN